MTTNLLTKKSIPRKRKKKQTKEEKLAELITKREVVVKAMDDAKESDPFWFYVPSDGVIGDREKAFLEKYLKPDDIPNRIDGQMDVHMSTLPIRGASGGNQSGKSTVGAIEAYIQATGEVPNTLKDKYPKEKLPTKWPQAIRIIGVDYKTLLNTLIPTYQKWVPRDYLKNGTWKDSFSSEQKKLFLYEKGQVKSTIEFMTNQQDVESFQGPPLDMVIYDEEPRESVYKENLLRFTTANKLNVMFCWTPTKGLSWTYDMFMDEIGDRTKLFKLCSVANKKANLEALDEIMGELTSYEEIKMRLLGEFISLSGLVYGRLFDEYTHVIDPFFETPVDNEDGTIDEKATYEKKQSYLVLTGMDPHLVTSTVMDFVLVDRENNWYVDLCYKRDADTSEIKADWHEIVEEKGYRTGWAVADKSSNSSIIAFGGRNIFRELSMGEKAIPALRTSEKYEGSIKAGVDEIKKKLKDGTFFIVDRPENKELIKSFKTLERETYANEDIKGPKDRISEGRHHHHAALRYISQYPVNWYPEVVTAPEPMFYDDALCY